MTQNADYGVNLDGDGEIVGLWFNPDRVTVDEHAYVTMTADEVRALAAQIDGSGAGYDG